jgi:hypothetical protein
LAPTSGASIRSSVLSSTAFFSRSSRACSSGL